MKIIEIAAMDNGAHRNQTTSGTIPIPSGWVAIPNNMAIPDTFPFVDLTVEDGVLVSMTPGIVPEPEPDPEPTPELTLEEQIVAAYREGVASA